MKSHVYYLVSNIYSPIPPKKSRNPLENNQPFRKQLP